MYKPSLISKLIVILLLLITSDKCLAMMKEKQGVFLEQGIGVREKLEIGKKAPLKNKEKTDLEDKLGLEFNFGKAKGKNKIWNIKCERAGCVTDKNVGVGDPVKEVLLGYGSPDYKKQLKNKAGKNYYLLVYDGIAFKIQKEKVRVIYILPPTEKK